MCRAGVRVTFDEAVNGCDKELALNLKEECETCHGTGARPGTSPQTCPKCGGKGQVTYTQQSIFGMVRNVQTCPDCNGTGKIIKEKCSACHGSGYTTKRKKFRFPFRQVLTMARVSAFVEKVSREQTEEREAIS